MKVGWALPALALLLAPWTAAQHASPEPALAGAPRGWFLLERDGEPFGLCQLDALGGEAGSGTLVTRSVSEIKLGGADDESGGIARLIESYHWQAEPPHRLTLAERSFELGGDAAERTVLQRGASGWELIERLGEHEERTPVDEIDIRLDEHLALDRWLTQPRAAGETLRLRWLHLDPGQVRSASAQVVEVESLRIDGIAIRRTTAEVSAGGMDSVVVFDDPGGIRSRESLGVAMRRASRQQAMATREGLAEAPAAQAEALVVDRPLSLPLARLTRLELAAHGSPARSIPTWPGQLVTPAEPAEAITTIVLTTDRAKAGEDETRTALASTARYPADHDRVRALAQRLVGESDDAATRVTSLALAVDRMLDDAPRPGRVPTLALLDDPRGDCTEHAALFVTLARAAGVPAREVFGLVYDSQPQPRFWSHQWCEVAIGGEWIPADPTQGSFPAHIARIRLSGDSTGDIRTLLPAGSLTLELLSSH